MVVDSVSTGGTKDQDEHVPDLSLEMKKFLKTKLGHITDGQLRDAFRLKSVIPIWTLYK